MLTNTKMIRHLSLTSLYIILVAACTPNATPPSFDSDPIVQDYDSCRNTTIKLKKPDAPSFRSLVSCLSGTDKVLLEYEDLLNHLSDQELNAFLNLFSAHLEPRLNEALDLLSRMEKRGLLRPFYLALSNLASSGQLQSILKLYFSFHTDEKGKYENNSFEIESKFADFLLEGDSDQVLQLLSDLTSNPSALKLAQNFSDINLVSTLPSDLMTSRMLSILHEAIMDKSFRTLLLVLGDKELIKGYKSLNTSNKNQMSLLFSYLGENSTFSSPPVFEDFVTLYRSASKPLKCFEANNKVEEVKKLTISVGSEIASLKDQQDRLNEYILATTPALLGVTMGHCDVDKALGQKAQVLWSSTQLGYGEGIASFIQLFAHSNRYDYKELFIKNPLTKDLLFIWEAIHAKKSGAQMLDLLSFATPEKIEALSDLMLRLASQNLTANQIPAWLQIYFKGEDLIYLNRTFEQLPQVEKSLFGLVKKVNRENDIAAKIRMQIAKDSIFTWDENMNNLYQRLLKVTSPVKLSEWQEFTSTLLKSWGAESGWSDLFLTFARATGLAKEKPFQSWLALTLNDHEKLNKALPSLISLSTLPEFEKAISLTGKLARSGDLERLVRFMIEIFKSQQSGGGLNSNEQFEYEVPKNESSNTVPPTQPSPVKIDYSACLNINGDLFEKGGANFDKFLRCLDSGVNQTNIFTKISNTLGVGGLLDRLSQLINDTFFKDDRGQLFIIDLKLLVTSGDLDKTLDIFKKIRNFDQSLSEILDKLVLSVVESVRGNQTFEAIGLMLNHPQYVGAVNSLISLFKSEVVSKQFESDANYKMPIPNSSDLYQKAKNRLPDITPDEVSIQLEKFSERGDAYFFDQEIYKKFSEEELKSDILRVLNLLLRFDKQGNTGDIEEFLLSLRDLANAHNSRQIDIASFLQWGVSDYRAVAHYNPNSASPEIRFVTPLDQLDLLVINSDFSVPVPIIGTDHMGTYFQLEIAKSRDLKKTLKKLREKLEWGVWLGEKGLFSKEKYYKFLNNIENFYVLEQMEELGYLTIMQRLYQAFYASTPSKYKDKEDPINNHISLIHQPTQWAFFSRLVIGLRHLEEKQKLRPFIDSLFSLVSTINESDFNLFREALHKLLHNTNQSSLSLLLDWTFKLDTKISSQFKDLLFHLILTAPKITERGNGIIEVLIELGEKPESLSELLKYLVSDLSSEKPASVFAVSYLAAEDDLMDLKKVITSLMKKNTSGLSPGGALISTLIHVATSDSSKQLRSDVIKIANIEVLKEKQSIEVIGNILLRYSGFRKILAFTMLDPNYRKDAMDILKAMAEDGLLTKLLSELTDTESSQNIATLVRFIEKHISSSPTRP